MFVILFMIFALLYIFVYIFMYMNFFLYVCNSFYDICSARQCCSSLIPFPHQTLLSSDDLGTVHCQCLSSEAL